jgi:uncharacterized RDD family membrane protein YckC/predicted Ser/Thr protein kinase
VGAPCPDCGATAPFADPLGATVPGQSRELAEGATLPAPPSSGALTPNTRAALEHAASLPAGYRLEHFEIVRLIGKGGMGAVYLARDHSLERDVALKVIATATAEHDETCARFGREARAQARVVSPNVVQIYFIGEKAGMHFFAMEYVDGHTVEHELERRGSLHWQDVLDVLTAVARALKAALERDMIHRDLKPSNLLWPRGGRAADVKVVDFGLAKRVSSSQASAVLTAEGVVLGTPRYISPEQGLGEAADHRSDIYSLGATAYHLLAGRPPFEAPTPMGVVAKHITAEPTPLGRACARDTPVPDAVAAVVHRMLAKDPAQRYQSYDDLLCALEEARAVTTQPAGFAVRLVANLIDFALFAGLAWGISFWLLVLYPFYWMGAHRLFGASIGKWALGLRLSTAEGRPVRLPRLLLRYALAFAPFEMALLFGMSGLPDARPALEQVWMVQRDTYQMAIDHGPENALDHRYRWRLMTTVWRERHVLFAAFWPTLLCGSICVLSLASVRASRRRRGLHDLIARTAVSYRRD